MATYEVNVEDVEPMSRTYQYRKVMKPMLERKRRARINKCLDELKDLMVGALQSEGESITKLEKADVLELTVRHLRKLKQHHALAIPSQNHAHEKFRAGFGHCATEVRRFVQAVPGVDMHVSARLLNHLGQWMSQLDKVTTTPVTPVSPVSAPISTPAVAPVNVPRVYTPPSSPEIGHTTSPALPSQCSPQPLSLTTKTQPSSVGVIFTAKTYAAMQQQAQPNNLTHPSPLTPPATKIVPYVPQPTSPPPTKHPRLSPSYSSEPICYSSCATGSPTGYNSEPISYSPRATGSPSAGYSSEPVSYNYRATGNPSTGSPAGIKVEVPPGSPVWRPWSA